MKKIATLIIITTDLVSYVLAAILSLYAYNSNVLGLSKSIYQIQWNYFLAVFVLYLFILFNNGAYRRSRDFTGITRLLSLVKGTVIFSVTVVFLIFILKLSIPRLFLMFFFTLLPIFGLISRLVLGRIEKRFFNILLKENVLVCGAGEKGVSFVNMNELIGDTGLNIIGFVDDRVTSQKEVGNPRPVLGSIDDIENLVYDNEIDRIIVAIRKPPLNLIAKISDLSDRLNIALSFLPTKRLWVVNPVRIRDFAGLPLVTATRHNLDKRPIYEMSKRFSDIFISLVGIMLSFPLFIIISLILKIKNDGPIFFKHERVGLNNKFFTLYKFRTMDKGTNPYAHSPDSSSDKRITSFGKWLRKTSLDELPQIFNVLRGEMSMVGPRPEMPFIVDKYEDYMKRRLLVKPGITGLWQISKARKGEIHVNPEYDLFYIENRGLALDFIILMLTTVFVVRSFTH